MPRQIMSCLGLGIGARVSVSSTLILSETKSNNSCVDLLESINSFIELKGKV